MNRGVQGGYSPWGPKKPDTTEQLTHIHTHTEYQNTILIYDNKQLLYCNPSNNFKELIILIHKKQEGASKWNSVYYKHKIVEFFLFPGKIILQLILNLPTPLYFLRDLIFFSMPEQPRTENNENFSKEQRSKTEHTYTHTHKQNN